MRCDECLPLVEEYFDGEVEESLAARVGAHLSACADCTAALDALSFEQEVYARYDRGGLEVAPDLWARVSAEIARTPQTPQSPAAGRPFLSRLRDGLTAALSTFAARPAFASSLALLLVGVTAGSLWLARRPAPDAPSQVAQNAPAERAAAPAANSNSETDSVTTAVAPAPGSLNVIQDEPAGGPAPHMREGSRGPAAGAGVVNIAHGLDVAGDDIERLLAAPSAPAASGDVVVLRADEPAVADEVALSANASAAPADFVAGGAAPDDPAEKDVARHVERAQMLLRSIKNVRASEAGAADIAYEKSLSRKLLAENATLQLAAEVKGDKESKQVLDQLEPFLLDIANLGEQPSREEVRSIRERVRKNEIVAALQVY